MKSFAGRMLYMKDFSTILLVACCLSLTACLTEGTGTEAGTDVVANPTDAPPKQPLTTPERTVCDPFSVGTSARDRGLIGNLLFLEDDQPRYTSVHDYINYGTPIASTLYFDQLFIPTRAFDLGFYTQDGHVVVNQHDQPVYEYFGLRVETQITLADSDPAGYYEFAILSDDGATMTKINDDGTEEVLVNNDGTHPTRMGCGTKAVYMDHQSKIRTVIEYYQGPRYHISLVVLYRPMPDGANPNAQAVDVECGKSGNGRYFNSNVVPSAPTATYYDLLTRGWKPLGNENYYFPEQFSNPCASEAPLLLTNFAINSTARTQVTVSWATNIAANSKVEVKNVTTGAVITSPVDANLVTAHSMTLTGLTANTLYSVKATSVTATGQTSTSSELAFRTPR
jgi:hypothetical protein